MCGLVYGLVTNIGLLHGEHALGFIAHNGAENILHLPLGGPGIVSALLTKRRHDGDPTVATRRHAGAAHGRREERFDPRDREFRRWRGARSARRTARTPR